MPSNIHAPLASSIIMFALALGLWSAWNYFRGQGVSSSYWGALVIGEILAVGQGLLGVVMVITGARPADMLHILYGALVGLGWPAVYIYTNGRSSRTESAIYALMSLAIFGLALRARMTG